MLLLPTAYMPPASYLSMVVSGNASLFLNERFVRQTIRSRMHILSPNGVQALVIPVSHDNLNRSETKNVRICYESHWPRQHVRSLQAAYGKSAFFDFFEDDLKTIYETRCEFL
ncbi:MAG: WbqC family protein, partial [Bacteroidota bacterium]